jgi:XTP/dITP diphosphohydrolase
MKKLQKNQLKRQKLKKNNKSFKTFNPIQDVLEWDFFIFTKTILMNTRAAQLQAFDRLLTIMDDLREKCPWDQKQTMQSLRHLTIEETYELGDAILDNDLSEVKKELGDLLLHIVFYAKIGSETSDFDIADVCHEISDKLIHRHPHIYSDTIVKDEEEVKQNWEKLKLKEGKKSVLEGVPKSLPALVKASRIQDKVKGVGFDWEETHQVWDKVQEELEELQVEVQAGDQDKIEAEFGDVLFSMINYARFLNVNPEDALERTNKKFIKRFQYLESKASELGKPLMDMTLAEMDIFWEEAKRLPNK